MLRAVAVGTLLVALAPGLAAQNVIKKRLQTIGEREYIQIIIKSPADLRVPKSQRDALGAIAPHELARYPRLVPLDGAARHVAWFFSNDLRMIEFVGVRSTGGGKFRLEYPAETEDKPPKPSWKEIEVEVDPSAAEKLPAAGPRKPKSPGPDDLEGRWAAAWARELAVRERLALDAPALRFARQELCRRFNVADPLPRPASTSPEPESARTIAIKEIPPIDPADHPWKDLLAGRVATVEALARATPASFYYLRVRSADGLAVLDKVQQWAVLGLALSNGDHDPRLRERYQRQLALPTDEQGRFRWPRGAREIALVGSDLHLVMGSDVTMLFAAADVKALRDDLDAGVANARQTFGDRLSAKREHYGDVEIESFTAPGGEVRLHRAFIGDIAARSNSPAALRGIIDVLRQQAPSLADTPEFRLLRSVFPLDDPGEEVLLFASETFLREQFGPRQRILLRRRTIERELRQRRQASALVAALAAGKAPTSAAEEFSPPLIERGLDKISKAEDEFYQQYREHYRTEIEPYVAPMGVRVTARPNLLAAQAFVMAPRRADWWDDLRRKLGQGSVARETGEFPGSAARIVASVHMGELDQARFKNWLVSHGVDRKQLATRVHWAGDRWAFHLDEGPALAKLAEHFLHADLTAEDLAKSRDVRNGRWLISQLPMTVAISVAKPVIFQGTLKKFQEIVTQTWPKGFTWEALPGDFNKIKLNRVQPSPALLLVAFGKLLKPEESPGIYYAYADRTVVVAPSLEALKAGVTREILPNRLREPQRERASAWVSLNLGAATELQGYLRLYLERESHRQALAAATLWQWLYDCGVFSGKEMPAERDAVARRWLGSVPTTLDHTPFHWEGEQREVVNERHGSPRQPVLHNESNPDAPWPGILADFARVRGELQMRPDGILGAFLIERK